MFYDNMCCVWLHARSKAGIIRENDAKVRLFPELRKHRCGKVHL